MQASSHILILASLSEYSHSLKKPKMAKDFGILLISLNPTPGSKVLADITKEVRFDAEQVAEQAKADIETNFASVAFYERFGDVLGYLDVIVKMTGQIASVCGSA
jgi:hypothetical protein